ncbi:glycosyltransferase [Cohnella soli]|uniref:Glycosyltransferase n=1 Tax=Cohnella soli TaxID=425005 RepID=A0ABW0I5E8_9BACL
MSRIAIASQSTLGHLLPALSVGREMVKRGNEVIVLAHSMNRALVEQQGCIYERIEWGRIYPDKFIGEACEESWRIISKHDIELMLIDATVPAASIAAEKRNIPWVSYQTSVPLSDDRIPGRKDSHLRIRKIYEEQLNAIRRNYGLPPISDPEKTRGDLAALSPYANLVMVMPQIIPDRNRLPPKSIVVGPCFLEEPQPAESAFPWKNGTIKVLVCTPSLDNVKFKELTNEYVSLAVEAFRHPSFQVILTDPSFLHPTRYYPNLVVLLGSSSHHIVLPQVDIVITHGGSGTLLKCIKHGKPMVIIPLGADHEILAEQCELAGVSKTLQPEQISSEQIMKLTLELHNDPVYRNNAERLARHELFRDSTSRVIQILHSIINQ